MKLIDHDSWFNLYTHKGDLHVVPTPEGTEAAKDYVAQRETHSRGTLHDLWDMLEHLLCNGWDLVRPEDVGALTDGTILSRDGGFNDYGTWVPAEGVRRPMVYWHEAYQVEDPVESWAAGKTVILNGARVCRNRGAAAKDRA